MATVIDALLVTLGFDTKGFTKGTVEAKTGLKSVKDSTAETGKEVDRVTRHMATGFARVRNEILGLYALITAGRGVRAMVSDILAGDAAVGRFAAGVGMSTQNVSAWQKVVERAGGSAAEFTSQAGQLTQSLQHMQITGQSFGGVPYFLQMGIALRDINTGKLREVDDLLRDMAQWSDQHPEMSQARKLAVFAGAGVGGGVAQALLQGRAALDRQLEEQRRLGGTKPEDAKKAQELRDQLVQLQTAFEELMRRVISVVTPTILKVMESMTRALQDNMPKISAAIDEFAKRVAAFDWQGLITHASNFAQEADRVATALGGWVRITEVLFGLWAVGKVLTLVGGITRVGAAIAGLSVGGAAAGGAASTMARGGLLARLGVGIGATGAVAGTLLAMLGFDPRKLLPETLRDALGTGHPEEDAPTGRSPGERGSGLPTDRPGVLTDPWYHKLGRALGMDVPQHPGQAQNEEDEREGGHMGRNRGFTPAQKEDLFLRFQQFLDEQERARKAVESAKLITRETALGDIARAGPLGDNPVGQAPSSGRPSATGSGGSRMTGGPNRAAFVQRWWPFAKREALKTGADPMDILAHWAQETGWGAHEHNFNVGNLQALTAGPDTVQRGDTDAKGRPYKANFYAYRNESDAASAYGDWILRHKAQVSGTSGVGFGQALRAKGYMENPNAPQDIYNTRLQIQRQGIPNLAPQFTPYTPGALRVANSNQSTTSDNSTSVTTGNITINTQATNAEGISRDFQKELQRRAFSSQANVGLR